MIEKFWRDLIKFQGDLDDIAEKHKQDVAGEYVDGVIYLSIKEKTTEYLYHLRYVPDLWMMVCLELRMYLIKEKPKDLVLYGYYVTGDELHIRFSVLY